jgi:hypothetical protein
MPKKDRGGSATDFPLRFWASRLSDRKVGQGRSSWGRTAGLGQMAGASPYHSPPPHFNANDVDRRYDLSALALVRRRGNTHPRRLMTRRQGQLCRHHWATRDSTANTRAVVADAESRIPGTTPRLEIGLPAVQKKPPLLTPSERSLHDHSR